VELRRLGSTGGLCVTLRGHGGGQHGWGNTNGEVISRRSGSPELSSGRNPQRSTAEVGVDGFRDAPGVEAELRRWLAGVGGLWRGQSAAAQRGLRGGAGRAGWSRVLAAVVRRDGDAWKGRGAFKGVSGDLGVHARGVIPARIAVGCYRTGETDLVPRFGMNRAREKLPEGVRGWRVALRGPGWPKGQRGVARAE
jgi:hypothetical protein